MTTVEALDQFGATHWTNTPHETSLLRSAAFLIQMEQHMLAAGDPRYVDFKQWVLLHIDLDGVVRWVNPSDPQDTVKVLTVQPDDWRWN